MFTAQFKIVVCVLVAAVLGGALLLNQLTIEKRVKALEQRPIAQPIVVTTPTPELTATPTATLRFVPRTAVTTAPKTLVK